MIGNVFYAGFEDTATHIVKENVDAIGTQLGEALLYILMLVVDYLVYLTITFEPCAFALAASNCNHPATFDLRDLRNY